MLLPGRVQRISAPSEYRASTPASSSIHWAETTVDECGRRATSLYITLSQTRIEQSAPNRYHIFNKESHAPQADELSLTRHGHQFSTAVERDGSNCNLLTLHCSASDRRCRWPCRWRWALWRNLERRNSFNSRGRRPAFCACSHGNPSAPTS